LLIIFRQDSNLKAKDNLLC